MEQILIAVASAVLSAGVIAMLIPSFIKWGLRELTEVVERTENKLDDQLLAQVRQAVRDGLSDEESSE